MNQIAWNKRRKVTLAVVLCAIIAVTSVIFLQDNQTTQAALINPHPGLAGWWRFDEGTGTVAGDSTGNGNNGTIYGATWASGKFGNALSFNGISNYVNLPLSCNTAEGTLEFWFLPKSYEGSAYRTIFSVGRLGNTAVNGLDVYIENGYLITRIWDGSSWRVVYLANVVTLNVWQQIVLTWGSNGIKLYLNAGSPGTNSYIGAPQVAGNSYVGWHHEVSNGFFNGAIDEVRVYNRALSAIEVQADFAENPDFSANVLAKVPQGTTQVITTLSWQGTGNINVTIVSPFQNYTESMLPEYQKSIYSTSNGLTSMLNIKRLSVSVAALSSDQNWFIVLALDKVDSYQITVEVQK
jgi:hypothetical protein